jgi:hypothetical protein
MLFCIGFTITKHWPRPTKIPKSPKNSDMEFYKKTYDMDFIENIEEY